MSRRLRLPAVVAVLAIGWPSVLAGPTAAATDTAAPVIADPLVEISLTGIDPEVPEPGDVVRLSGTVRNMTDVPLRNVNALLRYNGSPLRTREELHLLDSDPQMIWGFRPGSPFFAELAPTLAPGESVGFQLETALDVSCPPGEPEPQPCIGLQFSGVYVLGVDIMATPPEGVRVQAGTALTVLPWLVGADRDEEPGQGANGVGVPAAEPPRVQVAMLWPLTAQPALRPDGSLSGDGPGASLASGRLRALVDTPGDAPVTWVVDPDLLATADAIAHGDGRWSAPARQWLTDLRGHSRGGAEVWLLPYARPDLDAFDRAVAADLATRSTQATRAAAGLLPGARTGLAWPPSGLAAPATIDALASTGESTVVLSGDAVSPGRAGPWVDIGSGGAGEVRGLLTDPALDALVEGIGSTPADRAAEVAFRQRWLAETALAALDPSAPETLVTGLPVHGTPTGRSTAAVLEAWESTPWVEPVTVGATEPARSEVPDVSPAVPESGQLAGSLPPDHAASVARLAENADRYEALLAEPDTVRDFGPAVLRSASAAWRHDLTTGRAYLREVADEVASRLELVSVIVPPTAILSSATGVFAVNVVNDLDLAVNVRLEFASANPDRMSVEAVEAQRVEPGEKPNVQVTARAVANGKVPVEIRLTTVDGSPIGPAQQTVVNATDYGTVGWVLVAGAALLFAAGLAVRMARGRRRNGSETVVEPPAEAEHPERETVR